MNNDEYLKQLTLDKEEILKQLSEPSDDARNKHYDWIRHGVTFLTPSLALIIGLQLPDDFAIEKIKYFFLLSTIILMTISILIGLIALRGEAEVHHLKQEYLEQRLFNNKEALEIPKEYRALPGLYVYSLLLFPIFLFFSVLSLGILGVMKFTI